MASSASKLECVFCNLQVRFTKVYNVHNKTDWLVYHGLTLIVWCKFRFINLLLLDNVGMLRRQKKSSFETKAGYFL